MNQKLSIIAIFLLVALSFVNAIPLHKRVTTFAPCPSGEGAANPTTVSIQPDPPIRGGTAMIIISGTLNTGTIDPGSAVVIRTVDNTGTTIGTPFVADLCSLDGATCPIPTGASFSITLNQLQVPATLPQTYSLVVGIVDASNNTLTCALGTING